MLSPDNILSDKKGPGHIPLTCTCTDFNQSSCQNVRFVNILSKLFISLNVHLLDTRIFPHEPDLKTKHYMVQHKILGSIITMLIYNHGAEVQEPLY